MVYLRYRQYVEVWELVYYVLFYALGRAHTESTRHESTKSPPPLYPIQEKYRISCMETAHTDSMQHTCTWKKTYTGSDRQLQSSHKKIARQN